MSKTHPFPIVSGEAHARSLKTSEEVARDIVHDIVERGLQTGDRLSAEQEMLDEYSVSRESLREALRLLEVQGLISLRRGPGGGPVVGALDPASLGRTSTLFYHLAGATYEELCDAWSAVECLLVERAARSPDRGLARSLMEPYFDDGLHLEEPDLETFVTTHSRFHAEIASLTGNRVLEISLPAIGHIVSHHIVSNLDPRRVENIVEHDHALIARAVAAGHANKARQFMREHVEHLTEHYRSEIGPQMQQFIDWR